MTDSFDFLHGNAYHEAGHAVVGWALGAARRLEVRFDHLLPDWASTCDLVRMINLLAAGEIRETPGGAPMSATKEGSRDGRA